MGGAEVLVAGLSRQQRAAGHDVAVYCLYRGGPLAEQLQAEGFPLAVLRPGWRGRKMRELWRRFRADSPQLVHCHNATATILAAPAARLAGVSTLISTRHGLVRPPYGLSREIQFSLAVRLCGCRVAAVCEAARRNLAAAPLADPKRIFTVYNGAQPARRDPTAQALPPASGFTFLSVGRLAPPKDPALLVEALALARRQAPDLCLWIVGDGPLATDLRRLAAGLDLRDSVRFFGEQPNVGDFLAAAQAFVLCSRSEGLPVSLLEAMAAGLPSVVSAVGGLAEVVRACQAGIVVENHDPASFAEALLRCRREAQQRAAMGERARRCYQQQFTLERMAEQYQRLYLGTLLADSLPLPPPAASARP